MSIDVKVMVVGDSGVGKTCLLISYTSNSFPGDYVPTVFDNYNTNIVINDTTIALGLWDTAGSDEYDSLRPLSYPGTDIFLVCFSLVDPPSLEHVKTKWIVEIRQHMEGAKPAILLLGTKLDQRSNQSVIDNMRKNGQKPVTKAEGEKVAAAIGADHYFECSALTQDGLSQVFEAAVKHVLPDSKPTSGKDDKTHAKKNGGRDCLMM